MTELNPNVDFICAICDKKIHSACLLSPDWSATMRWKSALVLLREHNLKEHGIKPPSD